MHEAWPAFSRCSEVDMTADEFFGTTLFDMRRCIAGRAKCKTQDAIPAAHKLRRKVDTLPGKSQDDKLNAILAETGLAKDVPASDLLDACVKLWWTEIKSAIEPYDRAAHETHPRSVPIRRKYKKAKEYWAKYMFSKKAEFDDILARYNCKDVKFPYLTVVGTISEVQLAARRISEWPLKSNVFDIDDEGDLEEI